MTPLLIVGWGASGKSVLLHLLDSHEDIGVLAIHDKILQRLFEIDFSGPQSLAKDIRVIREKLRPKEYYNLEFISRQGKLPLILGSEVPIIWKDLQFDFHEFERSWTQALSRAASWDLKIVKDAMYDAWLEILVANRLVASDRRPRYLASMGTARGFDFEKFRLCQPMCKVIFVERDPLDILASRDARQIVPGAESLRRGLLRACFSGDTLKLLAFQHQARRAALSDPDRFLVVKFEELVLEPQKEMQQVSEFLEVAFSQGMTNPTFYGDDINDKTGVKMTGKINDRAIELIGSFTYEVLSTILKIISFLAQLTK